MFWPLLAGCKRLTRLHSLYSSVVLFSTRKNSRELQGRFSQQLSHTCWWARWSWVSLRTSTPRMSTPRMSTPRMSTPAHFSCTQFDYNVTTDFSKCENCLSCNLGGNQEPVQLCSVYGLAASLLLPYMVNSLHTLPLPGQSVWFTACAYMITLSHSDHAINKTLNGW